jgi:hypothetical protein
MLPRHLSGFFFGRPVNEDWDFETAEPPKITSRYLKHLQMCKHVLHEEQAKIPGNRKEASKLIA